VLFPSISGLAISPSPGRIFRFPSNICRNSYANTKNLNSEKSM